MAYELGSVVPSAWLEGPFPSPTKNTAQIFGLTVEPQLRPASKTDNREQRH